MLELLKKSKRALLLLATAITLLVGALQPLTAQAAVANPAPQAQISFTFDDGLTSASSQAAPTLAKYGLVGTDYVISGCVGMTTAPNTCRANTANTYMTWDQIQALQNTSKWEIGSHTVDHDCLASNAKQDKGDCQTKTLTVAQVDAELANSKSALASHGINATDFAPPYGDFSNSVMAEIAKYYASMRQFKNAANSANGWPYSDYYLQDVPVQEGVNTVASIESSIDTAIANKQWIILTFHDINPTPSANPDDYQYGTQELDQIAAYVAAKQSGGSIKSVTVNQGLVSSDTNMLTNGSFASGLTGWTTDAPANIKADANNNGAYPESQHSVAIAAGTTAEHLFSPKVSVNSANTYMLKSFLNVTARTSGEIGYYIDEYDASGNWISGQWKKAENSAFVEEMNFTYTPSSANVASASLQVYVTAGSGIKAYVDQFQWFALTSNPAPVRTNLVTNGSFDSGIAGGWTTNDPANITADSANHGSPSNPVNSVKLVSSTVNRELFSPQVTVDSTKSYSLATYLNLVQLATGEVGFYIDEYDANGNWISGQWKTGVSTVGAGDVNFSYTPSSANVAKASLQIIVIGNSGITAYVDDVRWYQN